MPPKTFYKSLYVVLKENHRGICSAPVVPMTTISAIDYSLFTLVRSTGGNYDGFIAVLRQRLTDIFIQNLHSRLEDSSRAVFYTSVASFQFEPYSEVINVSKFCNAKVI